MHITMVKKRLADGSDCRKCVEATDTLMTRGVWNRIDHVVWAHEDDEQSPGMRLVEHFGVDRAPFFIVRDESGEAVYTSVLQLIRDRLGERVSVEAQVAAIDVDDVGGI